MQFAALSASYVLVDFVDTGSYRQRMAFVLTSAVIWSSL